MPSRSLTARNTTPRAAMLRAAGWGLLAGLVVVSSAWAQAPAEAPPATASEVPAPSPPDTPAPADTAPPEEAAPEAGGPQRLIDQPEHDRIVLTERAVGQGKPREYLIERIPGKTMREPRPEAREKLTVRMLDNPGEDLEVRWGDIETVVDFEQMVLDEAAQLVSAGQLDAAFDYYKYLEQDQAFREYPGVAEAVQRYLFEDARALVRGGQFDAAWGVLLEVYERNSNFDGLARAMGLVTRNLVDARLANEDFLGARRLLTELAARFPNEAVVGQLTGYFEEQAASRLDNARRLAREGHPDQAQELATDAVRIYPQLSDVRTFLADQVATYPYVAVAVGGFPEPSPAGWPADFCTRRTARLLNRQILELTSYDLQGEGATYDFPLGEMQRLDLGQRLVFQVRPGLVWSAGDTPVTAHDLARRFSELALPGSGVYSPDWADLLVGVRVTSLREVEVQLRRGHVRPDALLATSPVPWYQVEASTSAEATLGPYRLDASSTGERIYRLNPQYFAIGGGQPKQITERYFERCQTAVRALEQGQVSLIDRVNPWELDEVGSLPGVVVAPYAVPTVHCLVPNLNHPLTGDRTFRRALLYAIERSAILNQRLLQGASIEGAAVISGPIPQGYAYNGKVPIRPHDPRMAITLANVVVQRQAAQAAAEAAATASAETATAAANVPAEAPAGTEAPSTGESPASGESAAASDASPQPAAPPAAKVEVPELVLAHPATELARAACEEIQRQLKVARIPVRLVELAPGVSYPPPGEYDLLYAELTLSDPIVDLGRLLGADGPLGKPSPYVALALRQLETASDWRTARERLLRLHELLAEELPLIPLWQLVDFFAYREGISQVGVRPVTLYQNVELWQVIAWLPPDA